MIQEEDLKKLLRQRPFQPFRMHLTDGRVLDICYPDMNLVSQGYVDIGIPEDNGPDPFADHFVLVPLKMVEKIEFLGAAGTVPSENQPA